MAVPTKDLTEEQARSFGETVRTLRVPLSQAELTEGRSFGVEWLSKVEGGKNLAISVSKLASLSEAFGLPKDALSRHIDGEPLPEARASQADPDALLEGHGGSEGWPPWLELKFRRLETKVERVEALLRQLQRAEEPSA